MITHEQWKARQDLRRAWRALEAMPDVWRDVARMTGDDDNGDGEQYARGMVAGLEMAAKGLVGPLVGMLAVLPTCEHGVSVAALCGKGCD